MAAYAVLPASVLGPKSFKGTGELRFRARVSLFAAAVAQQRDYYSPTVTGSAEDDRITGSDNCVQYPTDRRDFVTRWASASSRLCRAERASSPSRCCLATSLSISSLAIRTHTLPPSIPILRASFVYSVLRCTSATGHVP